MPRSIERSNIQWPTVAVAVAIYGGWLAATARHDAVPWPVLVAIGGWLLAWHGSLQHETIHGHPTRYPAINAVIGFVPLSLWLPYGSYHRSHRAHHAAAVITDPSHDPESRYRARTDGVAALLGWLQSTLAGQMIFGPPISVLRFLSGEARGVAREPVRVLRDWVPHLAAVAILIAWLDHVGLGLGRYILTFVYPGMALTMLRSYAEHRADLASPGLAASVEPIWRAPALRRASNRSGEPRPCGERRTRRCAGAAIPQQQPARCTPRIPVARLVSVAGLSCAQSGAVRRSGGADLPRVWRDRSAVRAVVA